MTSGHGQFHRYASELWREVLGRDTRVGNAFFKLTRELRTRAVERSYLNWLELTPCHAITFARVNSRP